MIILPVLAALALILFGKKPAKELPPMPTGTRFPKPMAVGPDSDPKIAALLAEMRSQWLNAGVDLSVITPEAVTRMRKAPGSPYAIPPREWWPRMLPTITEIFMPIRQAMGVPLVVGGYRPPDYNEAVGGAEKSQHQAFSALDIKVAKDHSTVERRRQLAELAGAIYKNRGKDLRMGFGVYGYPRPGNIHVDTGWTRRTWADAEKYL